MDSFEMKIKLLHYWRFKRRYMWTATEVGRFNSDVLASDGKHIVECEVKTTFQDLKNDFKKTVQNRKKHEIYSAPTVWYSKYLPNKFYFAIPEELTIEAKSFLKDTSNGIIEINNKKLSNDKKINYCKIVKRASIIYPKFNEKLHHQILLRMGSEVIRLRLDLMESLRYP